MEQTFITQTNDNYNSFYQAYKSFIIEHNWSNERLIKGMSGIEIDKLKETLGVEMGASFYFYLKYFGHSVDLKYYSENIKIGSNAMYNANNAFKTYESAEVNLLDKIKSITHVDDSESKLLKSQGVISPLFFYYEESAQVFGLVDQNQENSIVYFYFLYTDYFTEGKLRLTDYLRKWLWKGIVDKFINCSDETKGSESLNHLDWVQFYYSLKSKKLFWINIHEYRNDFQLEMVSKEKDRLLGINEYEEEFIYFLVENNLV